MPLTDLTQIALLASAAGESKQGLRIRQRSVARKIGSALNTATWTELWLGFRYRLRSEFIGESGRPSTASALQDEWLTGGTNGTQVLAFWGLQAGTTTGYNTAAPQTHAFGYDFGSTQFERNFTATPNFYRYSDPSGRYTKVVNGVLTSASGSATYLGLHDLFHFRIHRFLRGSPNWTVAHCSAALGETGLANQYTQANLAEAMSKANWTAVGTYATAKGYALSTAESIAAPDEAANGYFDSVSFSWHRRAEYLELWDVMVRVIY